MSVVIKFKRPFLIILFFLLPFISIFFLLEAKKVVEQRKIKQKIEKDSVQWIARNNT